MYWRDELTCRRRREGRRPDAGPDHRTVHAGRDPLGRLSRFPVRAGARDERGRRRPAPAQRRRERPAAGDPRRLSGRVGRDPGPARRADGAAVRALRRAAGPRRAGLGHRPVRGHHRAGRPDLRPRRRRRQVRADHPRRHPAGARRRHPGRRQDPHRGRGGNHQPPGGFRRREPRDVRLRRLCHRRHGQPGRRSAGADHRAAGRGLLHRPGPDAGLPGAFRGGRRRRAGRAGGADQDPGDPARRRRQHRRARASPPATGPAPTSTRRCTGRAPACWTGSS